MTKSHALGIHITCIMLILGKLNWRRNLECPKINIRSVIS